MLFVASLMSLCCMACPAWLGLRRDWGFMICGSDLPDAMASFDDRLKETLVTSTEAGDTMGAAGEQLRQEHRTSSAGYPAAAGGGMAGDSTSGSGLAEPKAPMHVVLAHAFKRLQEKVGLLRTQSEPPPELLAAAGVKSPKGGAGEGNRLAFQGMSEPSSPMIGTETLPDSILTISTAARRMSSEFRVPSIQAGLRPW